MYRGFGDRVKYYQLIYSMLHNLIVILFLNPPFKKQWYVFLKQKQKTTSQQKVKIRKKRW